MFIAAVRFIVATVEPDTSPFAKYTDPFIDVTLILPLPIVEKSAAPVMFESRVNVISETEVNVEEFRKSDGAVSDRAPSFEINVASESSTYSPIPQKALTNGTVTNTATSIYLLRVTPVRCS